MRITYSRTFETNHSPEAARALISDEQHWSRLLPGLEQTGNYWRYGGDLYELHTHIIDDRLIIQAVCLVPPRRSLTVTVQIADGLVTTRLTVSLIGDLTLRAWWGLRRSLPVMYAQAERAFAALQPAPSATATASLAERYPHTVAAFNAMNALDHLERVERLDAVWRGIRAGGQGPNSNAKTKVRRFSAGHNEPPTYDLIYAGGGLGLLHAAVMAQKFGRRVLLFDRGEAGCVHREWNISQRELAALVEIGLFSWQELDAVVMRRYERGIVRFHTSETPTDLWLPTVLNVALDAGLLLRLARTKLEAAGGTVLDQRLFRGMAVEAGQAQHVCIEVEAPGGVSEQHHGRLLLDGMGSTSPLALERFAGQPFAGVCPTVGTVVSGLEPGDAANQYNPQIGDILLSIDDAQRGQQYMWEGFPGRGDELTVYLFYYDSLRNRRPDNAAQATEAPSLLQLFEDYFALLPTYKRPGPEFRHVKPVYGYIPARHSLRRQEAPLLPGVLPVGDSAAQQSPLTFCGFGSHVRNLDRTTALLDVALERGLLEPAHLHPISAYQANVSLNWVFSRFMQPWGSANDVNHLQNIFLGVLNGLGIDLAERFFQDRMRWADYHQMVLGMFFRYPPIVQAAWQVLGLAGCRQWAGDYLRFSGAALLAAGANRLGATGRATLAATLDRVNTAAGLRLRAAFAEWQAAGWM